MKGVQEKSEIAIFSSGYSNVKVVIALGQSCICNLRTSPRKATVDTSHVMVL